ncbi:MAG TPA: hypothetical protein VGG89_14205 [Candidatus Baltobacteraceae bacterium]|jgi:hypothetical protein
MKFGIRFRAIGMMLFLSACGGPIPHEQFSASIPQGGTALAVRPSERSRIRFEISIPSNVTIMKSIAIDVVPWGGTTRRVTYANLVGPTATVDVKAPFGKYDARFMTFSGALKNGKPSGKLLSSNQNVPVITFRDGAYNTNLTLASDLHAAITLGDSLAIEGTGTLFASRCMTSGQVAVVGMDSNRRILVGVNAPKPSLTSEDSKLAIARDKKAGRNAFTLTLHAIPNPSASIPLTVTETPKEGPPKSRIMTLQFGAQTCAV